MLVFAVFTFIEILAIGGLNLDPRLDYSFGSTLERTRIAAGFLLCF